jgi:hypothetical protein
MLPYILTEYTLTVFNDGEQLTLQNSSISWKAALDALRNDDVEALIEAMTPVKAIEKVAAKTSGLVTVERGEVFIDGEPANHDDLVVQKILRFAAQGLPCEPLCRFLEKLYRNPSFRIRRDLMNFIEKGKLPITEDGDFLAYKRVRHDLYDIFSGTVYYGINTSVHMPRTQVDDDPQHTCSSGLHACSFDYLSRFGSAHGKNDRFLVMKISPENVVSIPMDHNNTKLRAATMFVLSEIPKPDEAVWRDEYVTAGVADEWNDDYEEEDEEESEAAECNDATCPFCSR